MAYKILFINNEPIYAFQENDEIEVFYDILSNYIPFPLIIGGTMLYDGSQISDAQELFKEYGEYHSGAWYPVFDTYLENGDMINIIVIDSQYLWDYVDCIDQNLLLSFIEENQLSYDEIRLIY